MKSRIGIVVAMCAAICGVAAEVKLPTTPKDKAAMRQKLLEARHKLRVETGGIIYSSPTGMVFEVVNCQNAVSLERIQAATDAVMMGTLVPIKIVAEGTTAAGATLEIVDAGAESTLLCKPEDGWARLNVRRLMVDSPSKELLDERLRKEMWRAIGAALGMGVSVYQPCIMRNIRTLKDLDDCKLDRAGPASLNVFSEASQFFGIALVKRRSYRKACEEGWAPAPTNDIQKAIWNEVRQLPAKPIKIEFDPAKGK